MIDDLFLSIYDLYVFNWQFNRAHNSIKVIVQFETEGNVQNKSVIRDKAFK